MFFSAIAFIIFNLALGLSFVYAFRVLLFHPSRKWHIGKFKVPLTPGFLFKQKAYWINKLYQMLHYLLSECDNYALESRITQLERQVYNHILSKLDALDEIKYIPHFIAVKVKKLAAQICFELFRQFIRSFVPYLIEKYKVERYIDLLNEKIDVYVLRDYYVKYVHRYLVYAVATIFFLLGLFNMLVYIIVR